MTVVRAAARRRWLLVAGAAAVAAAAPPVAAALPADAPALRPDRLYALIRASARQPYQGYVVSDGSLGLPILPQLADVTAALDGQTRLRAWYADALRWRVDHLDVASERDLYQTPGGEVTWDYASRTRTLTVGTPPVRLPRGADLVPPDLARRLVAMAGPVGSAVRLSRLGARRVAGIGAAGVRLTPTGATTTIGHVDVWADPGTGLPLRVEVVGRGASRPALVSRFLEVRLDAPDAAVTTPPPARPGLGTSRVGRSDILSTLANVDLGPLPGRLADRPRGAAAARDLPVGAYGTGFDRFVVVSVPRRIGFRAYHTAVKAGGAVRRLPAGLSVVLGTPLVTVLVMDSDPARRTYLVAGLTGDAVLGRAADELSTFVTV